MLAEVAVPLGLAIFYRINALVMALKLICLIAHQATGYFDLKLAMATRRVTIFEHQVHSALEILPLTAILLVMMLHWPQATALFGAGAQKADFSWLQATSAMGRNPAAFHRVPAVGAASLRRGNMARLAVETVNKPRNYEQVICI